MADFTIAVLPESQVSLTGGTILDGVTQGDGSHLVGEFLTLGTGSFERLDIRDGGSDANFDDNDGNQRLDGAQSLDGTTFADNTRIEAEYQFVLRDNSTSETFQVVSVNLNNSSPSFGTVEGLAFVDRVPPRGVALEVISAAEGPGSFGQSSIAAVEFVCFGGDTLISCPGGERRISSLVPGDMVWDENHRPIEIRWIGRRIFDERAFCQNTKLRPVRIVAGALGNGLPKRDLLVSRQHRILVQSRIASRMFGCREVLIPAIKLTALPGIFIDTTVLEIEYVHLLFERHEVLYAEGAPSESLFTGPEAMAAMAPEAKMEIFSILPEVARLGYEPTPARPIPSAKQQKQLIARHIKNQKPLIF
ncbi:MAG: Hint domain-containing protein [Pseudomonadota bacterium]